MKLECSSDSSSGGSGAILPKKIFERCKAFLLGVRWKALSTQAKQLATSNWQLAQLKPSPKSVAAGWLQLG